MVLPRTLIIHAKWRRSHASLPQRRHHTRCGGRCRSCGLCPALPPLAPNHLPMDGTKVRTCFYRFAILTIRDCEVVWRAAGQSLCSHILEATISFSLKPMPLSSHVSKYQGNIFSRSVPIIRIRDSLSRYRSNKPPEQCRCTGGISRRNLTTASTANSNPSGRSPLIRICK